MKYNHSIGYQKTNKNTFVNINTGEIKTITNDENKNRSVASLHKTFSKLSLLIKCNFFGDKTECFISLSYAKKISDYNEINRDVKNLIAKFRRKNINKVPYRCLVILEYQVNGNPHIHILLKRLDNKCLDIKEIENLSLWSKGTFNIKRLYDSHGLADYLNPFFVDKKRKKLYLYKQHIQVYRCYGDFIRPQKLKITFEEALNLANINNLEEYKNCSYEVINKQDGEIKNKVKKIYFQRRT